MPAPVRVADLIRLNRVERGLTQEEYAELIGLSWKQRSAVGQWEKGKTHPEDEKIDPLAAALGMSAEDLRNLKIYEKLSGNGVDVDDFAKWVASRMPKLRRAA